MINSSTLIDNSSEQLTMRSVLSDFISSGTCSQIMIATGYWDLPGTALLLSELTEFLSDEHHSLQILIGTDPVVRLNQQQNPKYRDAHSQKDFIRCDLENLEVTDEYVATVELLKRYCLADFDQSRIQIKMCREDRDGNSQFFHAKCYIFKGHLFDKGIIGSSNFTQKGLEGNSELNFLEWQDAVVKMVPEDETDPRKGHEQWFREKWDQAEPWNREFLEEVLHGTPVDAATSQPQTSQLDNLKTSQPFTPYELYIKLLQLKFGDVIDTGLGKRLESYLPREVKPLQYQIEAVKRCLTIMHEHGGFMLADVVGLGKTIIGILIARQFLSVPDEQGREHRVLIVCPPAILPGWKQTVRLFDRDNEEKMLPLIDFITTGRLGNLSDDVVDDAADSGDFNGELQQKNYGLILIDESHKFRNSDTQMYVALDSLITKIGWDNGNYPYIGLLSATPQNNRPNDLKNQIYLFERNHRNSTLKKACQGDLEAFFSDINQRYSAVIRRELGDVTPEEEEQRRQTLLSLSQEIRTSVLDDILERRTRYDIRRYYTYDMQQQGLIFPDISGPHALQYNMSHQLAALFSDTMTMIDPSSDEIERGAEHLGYYRYRTIQYFQNPLNKHKYEGRGSRDVNHLADQLANIMQILLVKRMESSFTAFRKSLNNLRRYTQNMIDMWDNDTIFICPQIDINKELDRKAKAEKRGHKVSFNDCVEDIRKKIDKLNNDSRNQRGQNAEYHRSDFDDNYIRLLHDDFELISRLCDGWAVMSEDPKFDVFKESLEPVLFNPKNNTARKLVIFTEAIDTVQSLKSAVEAKGHRPLVITAQNRDERQRLIQENFDANYEGEHRSDYDIIITTEVLAEGVNLHRANVILNYDTPWNSTRLMQRIGRVNRIGSKEPCVYVYNFMPAAESDAVIKLMQKAYTKLQSFHVLFGEDSQIFTSQEQVIHYDLHQTVEGEASPMEQYIFELKQYREASPERYAQIAGATEEWEIASLTSGDAWFLVRASQSAPLAIHVSRNDMQANVVADIDLIDTLRCEPTTPKQPLPDDWEELKRAALTCYSQYFIRIRTSRAGDKRTQALAVVRQLTHDPQHTLSAESRHLLSLANQQVRQGNWDIIRRMLQVGERLSQTEGELFAYTQDDVDALLRQEFGQLIKIVEQNQGAPKIVIGTCK